MASDYAIEIHGGAASECGECGRVDCDGHPELCLEAAEAYARGGDVPPWMTREEAIAQAYAEAAELVAARLGLAPRGPSRAGTYGCNGGIIAADDDGSAVEPVKATPKKTSRKIVGRACHLSLAGVPAPGEEKVEIEDSDVARIGKARWYGSNALVMYVLERRSEPGARGLVFFRLSDQDAEAAAWVKRLGKNINARAASRSAGYCITWGETI
jgi:hypothetical protein